MRSEVFNKMPLAYRRAAIRQLLQRTTGDDIRAQIRERKRVLKAFIKQGEPEDLIDYVRGQLAEAEDQLRKFEAGLK